MAVILALIAGSGVGYIFERGDFCFHSTWRGFTRRPRQLDLFRAYLLTILLAIPLVQGMRAAGWIDPWIPPFAWQANVAGGLIFGIGMVIGATCIAGLFYKLGHGMLGVLVGLAAWALGDIITFLGPLSGLRDSLNGAPITVDGQSATAANLFGWPGLLVIVVFSAMAIIYLVRSPRKDRGKLWNWLILGLATGIFMSLAWLLARGGGSDYTYGTSGVPSGFVKTLSGVGDGSFPWSPITRIALVPGAFIAARRSGTLWIRGETRRRYAELALGGFLMGIGAAIAGGCNLGHSLVGVPLLSLGSITTTLAMAAGVFLATTAPQIWRLRQRNRAVATV